LIIAKNDKIISTISIIKPIELRINSKITQNVCNNRKYMYTIRTGKVIIINKKSNPVISDLLPIEASWIRKY